MDHIIHCDSYHSMVITVITKVISYTTEMYLNMNTELYQYNKKYKGIY